MKKAYWSYKIGEGNNQLPPDFHEAPKPYKTGYDMRYDHAKCPAWKKWTDNTWMVTQPFDSVSYTHLTLPTNREE